MTKVTTPTALTAEFTSLLMSSKADFAVTDDVTTAIEQHGGATIKPTHPFPGWPALATPDHGAPTIETFVVGPDGSVSATSDNEPFVSLWKPLVDWLTAAVAQAFKNYGASFSGDVYVTASCTATGDLEGLAHLDDDSFVPDDNVAVVAIVGEHVGPRVALGQANAEPLRTMGQVQFAIETLNAFTASSLDHCQGAPDQIVLFPQFAQIHAGPAAHHIPKAQPTRQLLVLRGRLANR